MAKEEPAEEVDPPVPVVPPGTQIVTISAALNEDLVLTSAGPPPTSGSPVTFDTRAPEGQLQVAAYWLLRPVPPEPNLYQIFPFPAGDGLCLDVAGTAVGSPVQVVTTAPAQTSQLWYVKPDGDASQPLDEGSRVLISSFGVKGFDLGFPQLDLPLKDLPLQLADAPDRIDLGYWFVVHSVQVLDYGHA